MSDLDALIERSRRPGRLKERRTFTLSRDKAIEKQREFALRNPREYVLELVQAAVFHQATYIAIDVKPHSALVAWTGADALQGHELENLFDYLFADRGDAALRHLVQLAVGVNAILQRNPRVLRIESGDGERAVIVEIDAQGNSTVGVPDEAIFGTYLYAEFRSNWFARFIQRTGDPTTDDEQSLVEQRCMYCKVPILLNNRAPFGWRSSKHIEVFAARAQVHFDEHGRRGVVALHSSPRAPSGFRMVVGGVWINTLPLAELATQPLVGVICDDRLRKTADQSNIVQDHRYIEMLHAVQPYASAMMRAETAGRYRPPPLPPVPTLATREPDHAPRGPVAEPIPAAIAMLDPRGSTDIASLVDIGDTPLFYVEPKHVPALLGRAAEPDRFPWRVLVLTEGQVLTLSESIPEAPLHRITSKADVDFVRRVIDRRVRTREHVIVGPGYRLVMRLHLEGPMPDWGHGRPGVPFCVVDEHGTVEFGVISGRTIRVSGRRSRRGAGKRTREVREPLHLPRVSLRLEVSRIDQALRQRHVATALARAWELAVPNQGAAHRELLSALLGALTVPQFVRADTGIRVGASLPVGWPDSLRHVPIATSSAGDLALQDLLDLLGTDEVRVVPDLAELHGLDALEQRLGYGHLTHPDLEGRPLFGAGKLAEQWVWLDDQSMWTLEGITQMVWVGSTFSPRTQDARWQGAMQPHPELVAVVRSDVEPEDWSGGWELLFGKLQGIEAEGTWHRYARPEISAGRCEGMGRLALLHLADMLDRAEMPLIVPTDGGGRRSLTELRTHPAARVVARHGVRLAEPWTLALTRDELAVLESDGSGPALRYDEGPEVWRSLSHTEQGWLVRHEVRQSAMRGWLGLRIPHDGTAGILMRTTGELVALSEVDRSVPCHGLLWPEHGGARVTQEQHRVVQLAGLRLYQSLIEVLRKRSHDGFDTACRYATTFVLLSHRRVGRLQGTAAELARLVPVQGPDGDEWGSLETWLGTKPKRRPDLPAELVPPEPDVTLPVVAAPEHQGLQGRLHQALGSPEVTITLLPDEGTAQESPALLDVARSHRSRVILLLNHGHPLTRAAVARPGRERELLLLELARQLCAWAVHKSLDFDLSRAQLMLLGQRMDAS